jgi:hypothetical protein
MSVNSNQDVVAPPRQVETQNFDLESIKAALKEQVKHLSLMTSNLNENQITNLKFLYMILESNQINDQMLNLSLAGLFQVLVNKRFYLPFASRHFDRIFERRIECESAQYTASLVHDHDFNCLQWRYLNCADWIKCELGNGYLEPRPTTLAVDIETPLPIVGREEPSQPERPTTLEVPESYQNMHMNASALPDLTGLTLRLHRLPISDQGLLLDLTADNRPPPPIPVEQPLPTYDEAMGSAPCYECSRIQVRNIETRTAYHDFGHAIAALGEYGKDWRWRKVTIPPPFRMNSGDMKRQREIDLAKQAQIKLRQHTLVAAWDSLDKREAPKRSIKERNRLFREHCEYHCNGLSLVQKAKKAWHVVTMADEMLDEAARGIEQIKKIKRNITETTKKMIPHLSGLFARWIVQPPTFWACVIDLYILLISIFPDQVVYTFDQFMLKAISFKNGLLGGPIDANQASSSLTDEERKKLEVRYQKTKVSGKVHMNAGSKKKDEKDEDLTKVSFLTLISELLTGVRLKDRARWVATSVMAFGKTMRDINMYRKATLEVVNSIISFLGRYIKLAMWQKMFDSVPSKEDLALFVQEVEAIQAYSDDDLNKSDFPAQMDRLWKTAVSVRKILMTQKLEPAVSNQLSNACNSLARFRARHFVRVQSKMAAVRTVPFVISLVGDSGVHKSDTATVLAKDMCNPGNCNIDIGSTDPSELIYYYSGLKFCDGYRGQPVWFWDDIFQKKSSESTATDDDEYLKFIRYISNAQISLPMAHVDEKGRYLTSPLFITTSNDPYPNPKSVCSIEAVQRRRNILCYVTVDKKSDPLYPEEAVVYDLEDGTQYVEQSLQYMQFHILPSELKLNDATVGTVHAFKKPEHGASTGMSYTKFLEECVTRFNAWQGTASSARMFARTPASRVFNAGAGSLKPEFINRMDPKDVPVRMPHMNGGSQSKTPQEASSKYLQQPEPQNQPETKFETAKNPFSLAASQYNDLVGQQLKPLREFEQDRLDDVMFRKEPAGFVDRFLADYPTLSNFINLISDYFSVPCKIVISFIKANSTLFMFAAFVAFIASFCTAYRLVVKSPDFEALIPSDARDAFVAACHPKIQDEMDNLLTETTLELEKTKLHANMSAQGYDRSIMKGKAAKVMTKEAHLERMRGNISTHMNAGHANKVAVESVIYDNIRSICLKDGEGWMQAIGVCGHFMVVNQHFFQYAKKLEQIKNGKCWIRIGMNGRDCWSGEIDMQLVRFYSNDVAVFKLPKQCHSFRDIRKHFLPESKFTVADKVPVRLLSTTSFTRVVSANATLRSQSLTYDDEDDKDIVMTVMDWFEVSHTNLTKGDCGAPMFLDHINLIAGIHAASNGITGIVVPVWREMFDHCVEPYQIEDCPEPIEKVYANGRGAVDPVGLVPPKWSNFVLNKTDIKPSPICGVVAEVQKEPSVKSLKDVRISDEARRGEEPIWKSFQQYFDPVHDIPGEFLRKARIAILAMLTLVQPTEALKRRVLDEEEVLNGTRDGTFPSLNIHTSAGMPQRTYAPGKPGKTAFFTRRDDDSLRWGDSIAAQRFKKDYEHYEECLRDGVVPFVMLQEQLKDETLKKSKINDAKTRTFEVFPGPLALVFRKYFGAFNAAVQKQHAHMPISVGINPHSVAWQILYQRLNRFGGKVIAGDYVAWDKRLCGQAIYESVEIINEWYNQDNSISQEEKEINARVRLLLAVILIHSNVVVQRIMYQTEQGLPSGVPITSVLNSVANWLYLYSAIFQVLESKGVSAMLLPHELNDHAELALYGDDHIVALSAKLREFVTFRDIRDVFLARRVGYTDANKNAYSDFDFENLTDVTYLKRKFQPEGGRVYAPLDKISVEDQLNWINENKQMNDFAILAQCFHGFQIEAHLHGKEYFDSMMYKLRSALEDHHDDHKVCALSRLSMSEYKDHWSQYNDQYSQV